MTAGRLIVTGPEGRRAGIDFRFNAWGEAFTPYDSDAAIARGCSSTSAIRALRRRRSLEGGAIAVDGTGRS